MKQTDKWLERLVENYKIPEEKQKSKQILNSKQIKRITDDSFNEKQKDK